MDDGLTSALPAARPLWQRLMAEAITRPADLLTALRLDPALPALDAERLRDFPIRVPRGFVARMRPGDPADPLFLQVWPSTREAEVVPGYSTDAVGDLDKLKGGGLIHKYAGRALAITTGACAINCRYCFRRHFPYGDALASRGHWRATLDELDADTSIEEVILSGGDPLAVTDDKLAELVAALDARPWIRRLRLHTRIPVVLPERVDARLLGWLAATRLQKVVVLHINHEREIDDAVIRACAQLRDAGATLLSQAVLLRGINDSADAQARLSERCFAAGVLPYYLFVLDRVAGAAHFDVSDSQATALMQALAARLPGYLVPRLVREIAGRASKTPLPW